MKKWLAIFMACSLTLSASPAAYGQEGSNHQAAPVFKDLSGHWAQSAAVHMRELGLMQGDESGSFRPGAGISRAEFVTVLHRMLGFTGQSSAQFEDVRPGDWYYEAMMRANGSGIILGIDANHLSPTAIITREEAAVIIDRALQLSTGMELGSALQQFRDAQDISGYAMKALSYMTEAGVMKGYQGKLDPKARMTRAEFASLLSGMVADVVQTPGVYDASKVNGNLVIRSAGVTLKDIVIDGNLILAEGIGEGISIWTGSR